MRVFLAMNLPAGERQRLHAALEPLRARGLPIKWTPAESVHLTLKFLGEIEGAEVERIDHAMRSVAAKYEPMTLRLGGFGAFPAIRRASIVWIGIQPDSALLALQSDLELALSRLGYAREQRPFRPHLTIGRTRTDARPPDVERHAGELRYASTALVETIDLMRSHTGGVAARYEALLRRKLGEQVPGEGRE